MIDVITYSKILKHIQKSELVEDTIGILVTRPDLSSGNNILASLGYFHHLTGNNINFYLPGYGAYWTEDKYPDMDNVARVDGVDWSFSNKAFVEFVRTLEGVSKWRYSGESELLLIPYHYKKLDFSEVVIFNLDTMLNDGTISSVSNFVTELNRCVKRDNSVTSIATYEVVKCVAKVSIEEIIAKLPAYISKLLNKGKHYVKKDLSL